MSHPLSPHARKFSRIQTNQPQGAHDRSPPTLAPARPPPLRPALPRVIESYGKLPLSFEANEGQTDKRAKFLSCGRGYTLFLTADEAVVATCRATRANGRSPISGISPPADAVQRTLLLPVRPNLPAMPRMSTEPVEIGNCG